MNDFFVLFSRKIRTRVNQESPVQSVTVSCSKSLSQASSRNSSVTDISDSHVDISQHSLPAVVISAEFSRGIYNFTRFFRIFSLIGLMLWPLPNLNMGRKCTKLKFTIEGNGRIYVIKNFWHTKF